jgi:ankyrin repeat protein
LQYKRRHLAERMLTLGADPGRATKPEGAFTPAIIRCLKLDWLDLLPALVKSGADLNATDHHGSTALDYATASSDSKKWQLLLDLYQDPNATIADGRSLLEWSLSFDESVSLRLLEKGAKPTNQNAPNICPLSHAVVEKKRTLCEALLSREATLSTASSPESATLISRAIEHGWHDLIERLVIAGADINTPNSEGKSPALVALDQGHTDLFQTLIRLGARSPKTTWAESLQDAISLSNTNKLRTLLAAGIRPAADSDAPAQLLSSALTLQNAETLSILLEHQIHHPALYHLASRSGRTDVLRLLEKHSVKYDASFDSTYDHPIHAAIHSGCLDTLQHLLQHHQDIHILGKANQTPLVCAIARHRHDMVKLLLQYKADPNRLLENKANAEFLSLFTNNGIRWYLTFDRNLTPLMIAADSGRVNIARTLLEHGAKLGTWTAVNKTWPLNFACRKADVPMMRLLLRKDPYIETQHIVVNLARQDAQLFDSCGNVVFTTKISTGKKGFATPTGIFVITNKYREWRSTIYNGASMPCFQRFSCGDFGFHQGVVPGYPASHGCLRVPYGNAQKLFALTQIGDRVVIE